MSRLLRSVGLTVFGLVLLLVPTGKATALTQSFATSSTTATTTSLIGSILPVTGVPDVFRCTAATKAVTISPTGGLSIPAGGFTARGCAMVGLLVSVTQTSAWSGALAFLLSPAGPITGVLSRISIPPRGLHIQISGASICAFDAEGSYSALNTFAPVTPPALASILSLTFANAALDALGIVVDSITSTGGGCTLFGIGPGTRLSFSETLVLTPAIRGTIV